MLDRATGSTVWNWGPESPLKLSMLLNAYTKLKVSYDIKLNMKNDIT